MKRFSVHSNVHTPVQIVVLNNFVNCRSPFKNETLHPRSYTRRCPKIRTVGTKTRESCDVQNFDNQVNAVVGARGGVLIRMTGEKARTLSTVCFILKNFYTLYVTIFRPY